MPSIPISKLKERQQETNIARSHLNNKLLKPMQALSSKPITRGLLCLCPVMPTGYGTYSTFASNQEASSSRLCTLYTDIHKRHSKWLPLGQACFRIQRPGLVPARLGMHTIPDGPRPNRGTTKTKPKQILIEDQKCQCYGQLGNLCLLIEGRVQFTYTHNIAAFFTSQFLKCNVWSCHSCCIFQLPEHISQLRASTIRI
jgi:hypothetical protein